MSAIEANHLSKSYGPVAALRDVSFSVEPGEIIGLLGPNGAGKTTLMKLLTGYLQADEGDARVAGHEVGAEPLAVQAKIGYLPENAPVYRDMTVQEYLLMIAQLRQLSAEALGGHLGEAVEVTGLSDYLTRPIGKLSKGYRQRVGLAQALLHKPEILILDEPTTGLDPTQIAEIRALIGRLAERATVMLSTHILPEVEVTCERVLMIARGELRTDARLADLRATSAAIVGVGSDAGDVAATLGALDGVAGVELQREQGDYRWWRVTGDDGDGDGDGELCPRLYAAARDNDWRLCELRSDTRTLEAVFSELAGGSQEVGS